MSGVDADKVRRFARGLVTVVNQAVSGAVRQVLRDGTCRPESMDDSQEYRYGVCLAMAVYLATASRTAGLTREQMVEMMGVAWDEFKPPPKAWGRPYPPETRH